ncbi:conserved exported protein of unknown function [Tenacibaculum sp. 190524A02b]|uniref:carboxypeptidase-like regulatory domain-containing protein n=1 Tax=Tenacibaculum vairaonense TaxID=3137860 RepID=UPI0032B221CD
MRLLLLLSFFLSKSITAQLISFEGKLLDNETNLPVAYAHLKFKKTNKGVPTSVNGEFSLVIEEKELNSKILISCLNYKDTLVDAKSLQSKIFYLKPKTEILDEVIVKQKETKEIYLGSIKGKKNANYFKRGKRIFAQLIKGNSKLKKYNYLKTVTITFKENYHWPSKVRIRVFDRNIANGTPGNDLISKSIVIYLRSNQKKYHLDFSKYYLEVPENGFFIGIEKLFLPINNMFEAPIELSTYPIYKKKFNKNDSLKRNFKLLSFQKYRVDSAYYAPSIDLMERKRKRKGYNDLGELYVLNFEKWEIYKEKEGADFIVPMEIILTD